MTDLASAAVFLLAIVGALALIERFLRSSARIALCSAEIAAGAGVAESSARRGDLTRMKEGTEVVHRARVARRREMAVAGAAFAWIAVPPMVGLLPTAYAVAASLWMFPRAPMQPIADREPPRSARE